MNLVFHQLKKDILRTRLLLGFWLVLVILQFALAGWTVKPGDALMQSLDQMLNVLLTFFNYLLVLVLVPVLVHQEPLVGTTAFWFTRPLARITLLASKAWYVLLLVALPIAVQSIVFLANGVTLPDVIRAAPELFINELTWMLIVATLAVLTPNFARFAIVGATILIIWFLGMIVVQMVLVMRDPIAYTSIPFSLNESRGLVGSLITLGFGGTVVLLQYLTRRMALAIVLAVASVALTVLVQYVWPWDFLKPPLELVQDSEFKADAIGAKLASPFQTTDQVSIRGGTPLKQVMAHIALQDYPKGYIIEIEAINSVLKAADGQAIPLQQVSGNQIGFTWYLDPDAVEKALDGVPVLNMNNVYQRQQPILSLDADTYSRYASTPLDYSGKADFTAYKYVVVTELPLTKGAHFDRGSEHLTITDVLNEPDGVDIALRQRNVRLLFAPRGKDVDPGSQDTGLPVYLLLNKARHEAVIQKPNTTFNFNPNGNNILINEPLRLSFGPDDNNNNNWLAPPLDQAWLADAVLVRLELAPVAAFTRTLEVPGFRLDGKFDLPTRRNQPRVADLDALDQITLPHDATREQVRNYIMDVLSASRRLDRENEHDPQIGMLEKIGSENVDLLIQLARDNHNYYLNHAINALAQPDHKGMVVEALATNHDLIDTVIDHGWQRDAEPVLLTVFGDANKGDSNTSMTGGTVVGSTVVTSTNGVITSFSTSGSTMPTVFPDKNKWVVAIASLQDPSTYDSLKNYYIENPSDDVLKALRSLPNFDLAGTFDLAWKKARTGQPWQVRDMLQPAAQFGEPDVIEVATTLLKRPDDYSKQRARKVLKDYTPATGATDADLIDWLGRNGANLVFDRQAGKFVLNSPAAAPPPPIKTGN